MFLAVAGGETVPVRDIVARSKENGQAFNTVVIAVVVVSLRSTSSVSELYLPCSLAQEPQELVCVRAPRCGRVEKIVEDGDWKFPVLSFSIAWK